MPFAQRQTTYKGSSDLRETLAAEKKPGQTIERLQEIKGENPFDYCAVDSRPYLRMTLLSSIIKSRAGLNCSSVDPLLDEALRIT
jgi:hypothetical protein